MSDPMRFSHAFPGHLHPWTPPRLLSNSAALDAAYGALCQLFAEVMRAYYGDRTPTATLYTDLRSLCLRLGETSSFPRRPSVHASRHNIPPCLPSSTPSFSGYERRTF
ncbi:hypothetical protein BDZ89DRAFT_174019 [Hymenopellis radicata]|nr:hypothetical protein BDZ89DRAFT_174019 [Hymenopellis radicata]